VFMKISCEVGPLEMRGDSSNADYMLYERTAGIYDQERFAGRAGQWGASAPDFNPENGRRWLEREKGSGDWMWYG